jgi:hypothetical protein
MELDDFKSLYNRSADQQALANQNITEMITLESQGPLAQLQKRIRYTLFLFPFSIIFFAKLFIPLLGAGQIGHNLTTWLVFIILFTEYIVSLLNYFTIKNMQKTSGNVKVNLLNKLSILKQRYKWYFILHIGLFLLIPILLELNLRLHFDYRFDGLGDINPFLRIALYAAVFIPLFVFKKRSQQQNYMQHLNELNRLLTQMA